MARKAKDQIASEAEANWLCSIGRQSGRFMVTVGNHVVKTVGVSVLHSRGIITYDNYMKVEKNKTETNK